MIKKILLGTLAIQAMTLGMKSFAVSGGEGHRKPTPNHKPKHLSCGSSLSDFLDTMVSSSDNHDVLRRCSEAAEKALSHHESHMVKELESLNEKFPGAKNAVEALIDEKIGKAKGPDEVDFEGPSLSVSIWMLAHHEVLSPEVWKDMMTLVHAHKRVGSLIPAPKAPPIEGMEEFHKKRAAREKRAAEVKTKFNNTAAFGMKEADIKTSPLYKKMQQVNHTEESQA